MSEPHVLENAAGGKVAEAGRIGRFLLAGGVNTGVSVLVYQAALFLVPHAVAYALAYLSGIGLAYALYSRYVFSAVLSVRRLVAFALFYSGSLIAGTLVNAAQIEWLGVPERLAVFITIAVMLPVNYLGSRRCLRAA